MAKHLHAGVTGCQPVSISRQCLLDVNHITSYWLLKAHQLVCLWFPAVKLECLQKFLLNVTSSDSLLISVAGMAIYTGYVFMPQHIMAILHYFEVIQWSRDPDRGVCLWLPVSLPTPHSPVFLLSSGVLQQKFSPFQDWSSINSQVSGWEGHARYFVGHCRQRNSPHDCFFATDVQIVSSAGLGGKALKRGVLGFDSH